MVLHRSINPGRGQTGYQRIIRTRRVAWLATRRFVWLRPAEGGQAVNGFAQS